MSITKEKQLLNWFKKKKININEKTDLFSNSQIDSFNFIQILLFVEQNFKIKIDYEKIYEKKKLSITELVKIIEKSENRKIKKK